MRHIPQKKDSDFLKISPPEANLNSHFISFSRIIYIFVSLYRGDASYSGKTNVLRVQTQYDGDQRLQPDRRFFLLLTPLLFSPGIASADGFEFKVSAGESGRPFYQDPAFLQMSAIVFGILIILLIIAIIARSGSSKPT